MGTKEKTTLIKNVSIFNGTSDQLISGQDVVLAGNKIKSIVASGGKEDAYAAGSMTPSLPSL